MIKGSSKSENSAGSFKYLSVSDIKRRLGEKMLKKDVIQLARLVGPEGKKLLKLSLIDPPESANRASWTFREWSKQNKHQISFLVHDILKVVLKTGNPSVIRNLSGVWVDHGYPPESDGMIVDFAFRQLARYGQPVAVYANMLGILKPALKRHPQMIQEFKLIIHEHQYAESPWFKSRIKELLTGCPVKG